MRASARKQACAVADGRDRLRASGLPPDGRRRTASARASPGVRAQARREPAAAAASPRARVVADRARVGAADRLDDRELGSARGARHESGGGHDRRDPRRPGCAAGAQHLPGRSAVRQRRCPGPDRDAATEQRQGAVRSHRGGNEAGRPGRLGEGARLASCPGPRLTRGPCDARAVREADRGQGPVRLDHRRRRHARLRKPRRRLGRPPGGGPGDDLPDPGRRAGPLEGPQARLDHGSGPDQVGARRNRSGAGRLAEPSAATESEDAPDEDRRAADEDREPREEDQERRGEGPVPAPGQPDQARRPAVRPRQPADRAAGTDRRRAQGSQPGERPAARRLARLDRGTDHHPARSPGRAEPREARRDRSPASSTAFRPL